MCFRYVLLTIGFFAFEQAVSAAPPVSKNEATDDQATCQEAIASHAQSELPTYDAVISADACHMDQLCCSTSAQDLPPAYATLSTSDTPPSIQQADQALAVSEPQTPQHRVTVDRFTQVHALQNLDMLANIRERALSFMSKTEELPLEAQIAMRRTLVLITNSLSNLADRVDALAWHQTLPSTISLTSLLDEEPNSPDSAHHLCPVVPPNSPCVQAETHLCDTLARND